MTPTKVVNPNRSELTALLCSFGISIAIVRAAAIAMESMQPAGFVFGALFIGAALALPILILHGHYTGRI